MPIVNILGAPHAYDLTEPQPQAPTLVFIHGWLLSRSYWQPLIQLLCSTYSCLSYDLRGFGESALGRTIAADPCVGFSLSDYAKDLVILLKTLEISNVWLIGHSLGGSIALWGAEQLPQEVQGVICVNSGGGIYLKEEFERFRSAGQKLVKLRPWWLRHVPLLDLLFTRASVTQKLDRRWGRQRLLDFLIAHPEAAVGALLETTTEAEVHRLPQIVAQLQQPVYFVAGAQDPIMAPEYVRHLASFHPLFQGDGANVTEIPDCGHLAMLEQPTTLAARILALIAQHS
ncbi:MAG TPA: alpha/beta hydrolase [Thermosynechococcaceae cyanobacterium]